VFFDDKEREDSPWAMPEIAPMQANSISCNLWRYQIPHRGAFAIGDCWIDAEGSVFVGEAIVRAFQWEQQQDWLGISVEPSSLQHVATLDPDTPDGTGGRPMTRYAVPTKQGRIPTWCVAMTSEHALNGFLAAYQDALQRGDVAVIAKYVNTARFLIHCGIKDSTGALAAITAGI
jgi:hypothetical protein